MDVRAFERLGVVVECVLNLIHHEVRHLPVDVTGELDKSRFDSSLFGLPRQIERIDGDAMPAQAGARIERHEAEWLGGRGVDHFPDVDAHAVAHQGDLIGEADVDHAECILEQLDHLGHLRRADRNHFLQRLRVEHAAHFRTSGCGAANHFRNV